MTALATPLCSFLQVTGVKPKVLGVLCAQRVMTFLLEFAEGRCLTNLVILVTCFFEEDKSIRIFKLEEIEMEFSWAWQIRTMELWSTFMFF